jgi:hypothetical protein
MKNPSVLKVAYVLGVIADLAFGILLIAFPSFSLKIYGINTELSPAIRFWMAYAGTVIFTWTAFLIWGLMQPKERKFISLVTALVVLGLSITQIAGLFFNAVPAANMIPLFALQFILIAFFLIGYCKA